ncbi:fungal-specific transcription factor domain-containing protein [Xylogone sp. PMI_703]|nr:fungal-specific transcription factor domain-containing protein [Xylogone sp. PMI_703]
MPISHRPIAPHLPQPATSSCPNDVAEDNHNASSRTGAPRSFRRGRGGRACFIRCDAATHGLPCTNCAAFSIQCHIPPKKKKRSKGSTADQTGTQEDNGSPEKETPITAGQDAEISSQNIPVDDTPKPSSLIQKSKDPSQQPGMALYVELIKPGMIERPIERPGRVGANNINTLHIPLPNFPTDSNFVATKFDPGELDILRRRGAFALPSQELCDELVECYFKWVAPVLPVVSRTRFMKSYRDPRNPPSLLLMNAILLAGSRVCARTQIMPDEESSALPAATIFYQRAKALYEASYEEDRITIVQSLILMGWFWEDHHKVSRNVFYWVGIAVALAQGFGMHRSAERSRLSRSDKRLWKRIWWTLYTRDRSVSVALSLPAQINMAECDVDMICEDDFVEEDDDYGFAIPPNRIHVKFFMHYVKICEIMDLVLLQHYSVSTSKHRRRDAFALTQCDLAMAELLESCPEPLRWDPSQYNYWSALLHCYHFTISCLLHRAYLPAVPSRSAKNRHPGVIHIPRNPAFHAANVLTSILEVMFLHDDLRHTPPFIVYTGLTSLVMHTYQLHTTPEQDLPPVRKRTWIAMLMMERLAEVWLVAKMVHQVFTVVLELSGFSDCLDEDKVFAKKGIQAGDDTEKDSELITLSHRNSKSVFYAQPLTPTLKEQLNVYISFMIPRSSKKSRHRTNRVITNKEKSEPENKLPEAVSNNSKENAQQDDGVVGYLTNDSLPSNPSSARISTSPEPDSNAMVIDGLSIHNGLDGNPSYPYCGGVEFFATEVEDLLHLSPSEVLGDSGENHYDVWLSNVVPNVVPGPPVPTVVEMDAWCHFFGLDDYERN